MKKRLAKNKLLVSALMIFFLIVGASTLLAPWKTRINPATGKRDYYVEGLIQGARGELIYHNGRDWVRLARGVNGQYLVMVTGLPRWQAAAPGAGDMTRAVYDADLDGDVNPAAGGTGVTSAAWTDYVYVTAGVWAVDTTLDRVAGGLQVTGNADNIAITSDGNDFYLEWSDGEARLRTTEGVNTDSTVAVYGRGTGVGRVHVIDTDNDSFFGLQWDGGDDSPNLYANRDLNIMYAADNNVEFFDASGPGENATVSITGYITAGAAPRSMVFFVDDANDEAVIQAENNANMEGVAIDLTEANQRLRLRENADIASWYLDATDFYTYWSDGTMILQTDEGVDNPTTVRIQPKGTSEISELEFYDTDGERLSIFTAADRSFITAMGGALGVNEDAAQDVQFFEGATEGETPSVMISGFRAADAIRILDISVGGTAADTVDFIGLANFLFTGVVDANEIQITDNADTANLSLDGTDFYVDWDDGSLILITDEGVNTNTTVEIHPKGTYEVSTLELYDTDTLELSAYTAAGRGYIKSNAGALGLQVNIVQDVNFWESIASGNPSINISGWNTAGGDLESGSIYMGDVNDEFVFEVPNSANNEGITFNLQETNQRFRIRQNSDVISIYHDGTDAQFHTTDGTFIFDSDEAAAEAAIVLYDDDTNYVTFVTQEMAGDWTWIIPPAGGADGEVLTWQADNSTDWEAVGVGDVVGPAGATDNAIARYDGATGKLLQDTTNVTIDDTGYLTAQRVYITGNDYIISQAGSRINLMGTKGISFEMKNDTADGNIFRFFAGTGDEMTDTDARQTWLEVNFQVNQINAETGAAGYEAFKIRGTEIDIDTAALNWLTDIGISSTLFGILRDGKICTNQPVADTDTVPATSIYKMAIYTEAGVLIGYIPIHADW